MRLSLEEQCEIFNVILGIVIVAVLIGGCNGKQTIREAPAAPQVRAGKRPGVPDLPAVAVDGRGQDWQGEEMAPTSNGVE